jgi:hypothetical protein
MASSRRPPNLSGKPGLSWVGLGPRVGEDPSKMVDSRGAQIGRAADGTQYLMLRGVTGDDWHAVLVKGDEPARSIIEPIGTGTWDDAYWYCVNQWHWDLVSPKPRDRRRRAG